MKPQVRIALVGDYRPEAVAHQAIPTALTLAASHLDVDVQSRWLPTETITDSTVLQEYDAIWVVPGSPYRHDDGAFTAIRYAREHDVPFLGSCAVFNTRWWSTPATSWAGTMPPTRRPTARDGR